MTRKSILPSRSWTPSSNVPVYKLAQSSLFSIKVSYWEWLFYGRMSGDVLSSTGIPLPSSGCIRKISGPQTNCKGSCASSWSVTRGVEFCHVMVYVTQVVAIVVNVWSCLRLQFRRFPEWCFPRRMGGMGKQSSRTWTAIGLLSAGVRVTVG